MNVFGGGSHQPLSLTVLIFVRQTRKLKAGEILFDEHSESRDFFVVVDGAVQIFLKTNNSNSSSNNSSHDEFNDIDSDIEDSDLDLNLGSKQWKGHILLNEVRTGG